MLARDFLRDQNTFLLQKSFWDKALIMDGDCGHIDLACPSEENNYFLKKITNSNNVVLSALYGIPGTIAHILLMT